MTSAVTIPVLETERTRLRAPRMSDFKAFAAHCASDRAHFSTGRLNRGQAWREFSAAVGGWALQGHGAWSIEARAGGTYWGEIAIMQPAEFPEVELGWTLMTPAEGKGIAFEAAQAALKWAFAVRGLTTLVSYITPENLRSIRLAERLGAEHDPAAPLPDGETANDTVVYRHARGAWA
ncbi:MAG: GNAT family N-acetyltransferase [Pseudomonadota bacterium]